MRTLGIHVHVTSTQHILYKNPSIYFVQNQPNILKEFTWTHFFLIKRVRSSGYNLICSSLIKKMAAYIDK